jgi:hypothetical protein
MPNAETLRLLAETNAKFLRGEDAQESFHREIERFWPRDISNPNLIEEALSTLNAYGSVMNVSDSAYRQWVYMPYVNQVRFPGYWRIIGNRKYTQDNEAPDRAEAPGVIQKLRKGFTTAITWGATAGVISSFAFDEAFVDESRSLFSRPYGTVP